MTESPDHRSARRAAGAAVDVPTVERQLDDEEHRLRSLIDRLERSLNGGGHPAGDDHGPAGRHLADLASDTLEREVDMTLLADLTAELEELRHARDRLARARYGLCERCHQPISMDRLGAVPAARFCVRDEERYELGGVHLADLQPEGPQPAGRPGPALPAPAAFELDGVLAEDDDYTADDEYAADEAAAGGPEDAAMQVRDATELEAEEREPLDWEDLPPDERDGVEPADPDEDAADALAPDDDAVAPDAARDDGLDDEDLELDGEPRRDDEADAAPDGRPEVELDVATLVERQLGRA